MNSLDELLTALGDTADQVATFLQANNIKGAKGRSCHCPVAEYLRGTGTFDDPGVDYIWVDAYAADLGDVRVRTPLPVAKFIRRFDRGSYPDLDVRGAGR